MYIRTNTMNCCPHGVCENQSPVDRPALSAVDRNRVSVTFPVLTVWNSLLPEEKFFDLWSDPSPSRVMR